MHMSAPKKVYCHLKKQREALFLKTSQPHLELIENLNGENKKSFDQKLHETVYHCISGTTSIYFRRNLHGWPKFQLQNSVLYYSIFMHPWDSRARTKRIHIDQQFLTNVVAVQWKKAFLSLPTF